MGDGRENGSVTQTGDINDGAYDDEQQDDDDDDGVGVDCADDVRDNDD